MMTMTYTNSVKGSTFTEQVRVSTILVGRELIDQWNRESTNHCNQMYRYEIVDFSLSTKEDMEKLGYFHEVHSYSLSDGWHNFIDKHFTRRVHAY